MLPDDKALSGSITAVDQIKAVNIKFLESQLEAIPQCLLQFYILWNKDIQQIPWYRWVSLFFSLVSVSKGSLDYIRITLSGNKNNFNIVYFPFKFFGDYLSFNGGYTTSDAQKNVSRVGEKKLCRFYLKNG